MGDYGWNGSRTESGVSMSNPHPCKRPQIQDEHRGLPADRHSLAVRKTEMKTLPDGDRLLLLKEVAEALRVSDKSVRRLIDEGKLKSLKVRWRILIRSSDLMAYVSTVEAMRNASLRTRPEVE